jgi:hypothetical protein
LFITRTGHAVLREEGDVTRERIVIRKRQQKAFEAADVVPHEEAGTLFRPGLLNLCFSFVGFSLCLSRAYRGKMMTFCIKSGPEKSVSYRDLITQRLVVGARERMGIVRTCTKHLPFQRFPMFVPSQSW